MSRQGNNVLFVARRVPHRHVPRDRAGIQEEERTAAVRDQSAYLAWSRSQTNGTPFSPDKNPGVKGAHDRFARLGVVSKILRDAEGRKRYGSHCAYRTVSLK